MILYPCAKVNLGLNVISRRKDGYHDLETVFFPIPLTDTLELEVASTTKLEHPTINMETEGLTIKGKLSENIVVKAFNILAKDYKMSNVRVRLTKRIPTEAGLGGGSSDAASMLMALNDINNLNLSYEELMVYASQLGADCAFFLKPEAVFATGIGNIFSKINLGDKLKEKWMLLVKPDISISTKEAYCGVTPAIPELSCKKIVEKDICEWKEYLSNDFEKSVFIKYPTLNEIKEYLYEAGAIFALMSGSGSTVFGIFQEKPTEQIIDKLSKHKTILIHL